MFFTFTFLLYSCGTLMEEYLHQRYGWTIQVFQQIDWEAQQRPIKNTLVTEDNHTEI